MQLLQEIQTMMENEIQVLPSDSKARIILLDIDIDWTQKNDEDICRRNSSCASAYVRCFLAGSLAFRGRRNEGTWYGTLSHKPNGEWIPSLEMVMLKFPESGDTVFRGASLFREER